MFFMFMFVFSLACTVFHVSCLFLVLLALFFMFMFVFSLACTVFHVYVCF